MPTKIEWAEETWNPVTGCTPVSAGCENCYARRMAARLRGRHGYPEDEPFAVTLRPDRLEQPFRWLKPRKVFVCSMGDLFHEDVPFGFIAKVFGIMHSAKQHIFMVLTKRPERMKEFFEWFTGSERCGTWPKEYPHVMIGVTAENQEQADKRIPVLLQIPAAVRFVSVEPMLGPVRIKTERELHEDAAGMNLDPMFFSFNGINANGIGVDWVICGGETGPGARPMNPGWPRSLRDQCQAAGVPFFFKQWGEWGLNWLNGDDGKIEGSEWMDKMGRRLAGRLLDGREWNEYPGTCVNVITERTETHECNKERTETHSDPFQNGNNQGGAGE